MTRHDDDSMHEPIPGASTMNDATQTTTNTLDVLTVPETAALLRLPASTVYRMLCRGEIRGTRLARRWRVRRSDLLALFEATPGAQELAPRVVTGCPAPRRPGRPRKHERPA